MSKTSEEGRIDEMIEAVMKVARGDYSVQIGFSGRNDDLDSLTMGFNMMVDDIKTKEEALHKQTDTLEERVKELRCLYGISVLVQKSHIPLEAVLQGIVDLILSAWQYPEITCVRLIMEDQVYKTNNFKQTIWRQTADISVHGNRVGTLEICYLEERPKSDEGPFLKEERMLINGIAEELGRIIEHEGAKGEIKRRTEEWRRTFDAIADFVSVHDKDFRLIRVNKSFADALKVKPKDLIGKRCYEIFHKSDKPWPNCPFKEVLKDGKTHTAEVEDPNIGLPLLSTASPIFDQKGELVGAVHISKDITEQKKAEKALIRSEKLKALGEMAGGVAHDFNNFLAIILGNAQLLERGVERYKLEEIKERLRIIAQTAYEGGETVRRLQYFNGTEASTHDFIELDLNEIVRQAIISTSPRWKDEVEVKGIIIRINEELGELPSILGSRSELMEVLTNLIFNSLEVMPEGGEITIRTEAKEKEVLLYFTDTGKGIPKRIRNKIFDPFFTTKGPKASGLGLSVSYGIVERHQGKIKIESVKGKGTTFTISIPISSRVASEKKKVAVPKKMSPKKILVVDDEEGIREVLKKILQDEGHRTVLVGGPREGLEKFKQDNSELTLAGLEDKFDLVLTDLGMPEMSGWQLAKKIKQMDPDMPVGLITGWTVPTTKKKMKEQGVDFILCKPFDYAKVVREVNAVLKSNKNEMDPKNWTVH